MTDPRIVDYLDQMLGAAAQIGSYIEGMDKAGFLADKRTQDAVVLNLIVLGEIATRLLRDHADFTDDHPSIPWRAMKGMRNRIAHGYFDINLDVVWDTVTTPISQLVEGLAKVRNSAG